MPSKPTVEVSYDFDGYQWGHRFYFRGKVHQVPRYNVTLTVEDGTITGNYNVIREAGGWDEIMRGAMRELANEMEVSEDEDDDFDELEVGFNEVYIDIENCDLKDAYLTWTIDEGEVRVYSIQLKEPLSMVNTVIAMEPVKELGVPFSCRYNGEGLFKWPFPGCSMEGTPLFAHERYFEMYDQHGLIVTKELGYQGN